MPGKKFKLVTLILGAGLLIGLSNLYVTVSRAQATSAPSGACGFVMNKNFGGLAAASVGYDFPQNYIGIINFDNGTMNGSLNSVKNYQQSTATVSHEIFQDGRLVRINPDFSGSFRYDLNSASAYLTVLPVNGGNTYLLMLDYGANLAEPSATGVCQKM